VGFSIVRDSANFSIAGSTRCFDVVFVHFERNRDEFVQTFGIAKERVGVIVHGNERIFDELRRADITPASLRARLGILQRAGRPLFGTLSRYKGVDVLLDASRRFIMRPARISSSPDIRFTISMSLCIRSRRADSALTTSSRGCLNTSAQTKSRPGWNWRPSSCFPIATSIRSGALQIAQTFGVPIVASAIGAMQDVIEDRRSGLLVPPEDPKALAARQSVCSRTALSRASLERERLLRREGHIRGKRCRARSPPLLISDLINGPSFADEDAKLEVSYRGFQMTAVVVLVIASSAPAIAQPHAVRHQALSVTKSSCSFFSFGNFFYFVRSAK